MGGRGDVSTGQQYSKMMQAAHYHRVHKLAAISRAQLCPGPPFIRHPRAEDPPRRPAPTGQAPGPDPGTPVRGGWGRGDLSKL